MDIEVGNIVRLKKDFECSKGFEQITVINRIALQVVADGIYRDNKEFCMVSGGGFTIGTECSNLIKVKEKGTVPVTLLPI